MRYFLGLPFPVRQKPIYFEGDTIPPVITKAEYPSVQTESVVIFQDKPTADTGRNIIDTPPDRDPVRNHTFH